MRARISAATAVAFAMMMVLSAATASATPASDPAGAITKEILDGQTVHLSGWAYDPSHLSRSIRVLIYIDDSSSPHIITADRRSPKPRAYPDGHHGWTASLSFPKGGRHDFDIWASTGGAHPRRTLIARKYANVPSCPTGTAPYAIVTNVVTDPDNWAAPGYEELTASGSVYNPTSAPITGIWMDVGWTNGERFNVLSYGMPEDAIPPFSSTTFSVTDTFMTSTVGYERPTATITAYSWPSSVPASCQEPPAAT